MTITTTSNEGHPEQTLTSRDTGANRASGLPLVLVTVGDKDEEFDALSEHLDRAARALNPGYQSLVVARPEMPQSIFNVLKGRIRSLEHVHLRRLDDTEFDVMAHETGTFLASKAKGGR